MLDRIKKELDQEIIVLAGIRTEGLSEIEVKCVTRTIDRLLVIKAKIERELQAIKCRTVSITEMVARERALLYGTKNNGNGC